jgi:Gram-negative bacterial TonB protein C-terminal
MYNVNKNRFRNFCVGLSVACTFVLWAFNVESTKEYNVIDIIYDTGDEYVQIESHMLPDEPEPQIEKRAKPETIVEPFKDNLNLKIVDDLKTLKTKQRQIFQLTVKRFIPKLPTPVKPSGIEKNPDVFPQFPGGKEALLEFLESNVFYPESCVIQDRSGMVAVRFVVDEFGKISNTTVVKDELGCRAAEEALRVMKKMPRWSPGMKNGVAVKSHFVQIFRFRMY